MEKFNERGPFGDTGRKLNKNFRTTRRHRVIVDSQTLDITETELGTKIEVKKGLLGGGSGSAIPRWG